MTFLPVALVLNLHIRPFATNTRPQWDPFTSVGIGVAMQWVQGEKNDEGHNLWE